MTGNLSKSLAELTGHGLVDFCHDDLQPFPRFQQVFALAMVKVPFIYGVLIFRIGIGIDCPRPAIC